MANDQTSSDAGRNQPDAIERVGAIYDAIERHDEAVREAAERRGAETIDLAAAYRSFRMDEQRAVRFEDLASAFQGGLKPPAQLVENLIVAQQVNWLSGHPGHGKTTVAMWAACLHMQAGGHVVWIDWEAGIRDTLLRLIALGAPEDLTVERFHYVYSPHITADASGFASLKFRIEELPGADEGPGVLVVFDSASKALSVAGLDENSPPDATRWTTQIVMPVRSLSATALVIDHVAKTSTRSNPYPRGAGSKLADTEVAWYVEATKPFSASQVGEVLLTRQKDRNGVLPLEVMLSVGNGHGELPVEVIYGAASGRDATFMELKRRIVETLRTHDGQQLTQSQLTGLIQGNASSKIEAARAVATDPSEPVRSGPGKGNQILYWYDASAVAGIVREVLGGDG